MFGADLRIGPRLLLLDVCATLMVGWWWRIVRRTQGLEQGSFGGEPPTGRVKI